MGGKIVLCAVGWLALFKVALSLTVSFISTLTMTLAAPPNVVCDPEFVAEMPGSGGVVLKIGHFDEVDGVTHVENLRRGRSGLAAGGAAGEPAR